VQQPRPGVSEKLCTSLIAVDDVDVPVDHEHRQRHGVEDRPQQTVLLKKIIHVLSIVDPHGEVKDGASQTRTCVR